MTPQHLILLLLVNALWGFNFIAGKIGTTEFGPLLFSTLRFTVVLILLFPFIRIVAGQMRLILSIGMCLGVGHYSIMFFALYLGDNVSSIAIAAQLTVPFSTILAIVFLHERIGLVRTLAISISFLGVVVIGFEPISGQHVWALLIATVASAVMAVAAILMRKLKGVGVFNLQGWIALVSTVSLAVLTILIEAPTIEQLRVIPIREYWSPVYSGIGATIIGHGSLYYLLQRYPISYVTPFITLSTLFAIGFSVWLLGDTLTPRILTGGLLTLLGVTIIAQRNSVRSTPTSLRVPG